MYYLANSSIHGKGIFASKLIKKDEFIGVGIDYLLYFIPSITTDLGQWLNHSYHPNAYLKYHDEKYYIVAKMDIHRNKEITINYRETPWYIMGPGYHFK